MAASHYDVLGVRVDAITRAEAVSRILDRALDRKQPPVAVVKQYVELMSAAAGDENIRKLLNDSWLCLPEGVSTQWATAYLYDGKPSLGRLLKLGTSVVTSPGSISRQLPEKFGGTVFTWELLKAAARDGARVYLVGSPQQSNIAATITAIYRQLPKLKIVGSWPGELEGLRGAALRQALKQRPVETALVKDLKATKPDIVLIGMGFPLQEELIAKIIPQLSHGVLIGEGGTFDYDSFGGIRRKAPGAVQRSGLEWLWRLGLEPRRWRRQTAIPRFIWQIYNSGRQKTIS